MAARRTAAAVHVTHAPVTDAPRLDVWLAHERTITRHAAHTLIAAGLVSVNGRRGRPGQRVHQRDAVEVVDVPEAAAGTGVEGASRRRAGPLLERRASPELSGGTPAGFRPRTPQHLSQLQHPKSYETAQLNIVYEDDWLAVVDKPAGMVVHPAPVIRRARSRMRSRRAARRGRWSGARSAPASCTGWTATPAGCSSSRRPRRRT